jgi:hypothetical protein
VGVLEEGERRNREDFFFLKKKKINLPGREGGKEREKE